MKRENLDRGWSFSEKWQQAYSEELIKDAAIVDLPHDFTIDTDVSEDAPGGPKVGFYKGGLGSYTKFLDIPTDWEGKRILVEIDGAYMNTEVNLNGNFVAMHPYGYATFQADLTPFVEFGKKNRLLIAVNNSMPYNSRWYTGSGLYRHVNLLTAPMVHLTPWPIFAHTDRVENGTAFITAEVTAENHTGTDRLEYVNVTMSKEDSGEIAASGRLSIFLPAGMKQTGKVQLVVENAALWDIDNPQLYTVKAQLGESDCDSTLFGIRTVTVDVKNGLLLNGKSVKIKGGCVHSGDGILGAASFYDSEYRRMELHKRNGFNGIRCAHNPPSQELLEACDRLGLLVLDEAFDMWRMSEYPNDYHVYFDAWWKVDMELFMKRDRNHPCVIIWGIGNETRERNGVSKGYQLCAEIAEFARSLDTTRPLISAIPVTFNGLNDDEMIKMQQGWRELAKNGLTVEMVQNLGNAFSNKIWGPRTEPYAAPLDIVGYNYLHLRYDSDGETYPNRVICGTESYPGTIDQVWDRVERLPYVIGDFTWTSYDYIGEAGLGQAAYLSPEEAKQCNPFQGPEPKYPWCLAYCSDFDFCGFERPQLHYRKIVWGSKETYLAVRNPANMNKCEVIGRWGWPDVYPEWTFDGADGCLTKVDVYSAAQEVELFLNGKSIGRQPAGKDNRFTAHFELKYEPGTLTAVSLDHGVEVSRNQLSTAEKAVGVRIKMEKDTLKADGRSLAYALIEIVDGNGRRVPFDDRKAKVNMTGCGTLAAFGTGRPATEENYRKAEFTSFLGRYQAIIRSGYEPGEAKLKVSVDGIGEAEAVVKII